MILPRSIDATVSCLYGDNYSAENSIDSSSISLLRVFVEPMWPSIVDRFHGTARPEPLIVPVESPAGRPTTFRDQQTEVLVFDMHLIQLLFTLTVLDNIEVGPQILIPALASIYAERAFSAGNTDAAVALHAGTRIALASSPPIVVSESDFFTIETLSRTQLGFVTAHELAHVAFGEYPDRAAKEADDHGQQIREILRMAGADMVPELIDSKPIHERLRKRGYGPNAHARHHERFPSGEQPVPWLSAWDALRENKEFMIEILADHMALVALLRSHRLDFDPEFLASAAALAVTNLNTLQYLDHLASGAYPPSLGTGPMAPYWQGAMRYLALRASAFLYAMTFEGAGEPKYAGAAKRIERAMKGVQHSAQENVMTPLSFSIDFLDLEREFSADGTVTRIVHGIDRTPKEVRRYLGFGPVPAKMRAAFVDYINLAVRSADGSISACAS